MTEEFLFPDVGDQKGQRLIVGAVAGVQIHHEIAWMQIPVKTSQNGIKIDDIPIYKGKSFR
ncbi:MAG: hypothetical protein H7834_07035 [Magnetococcus sp. YQC-9]